MIDSMDVDGQIRNRIVGGGRGGGGGRGRGRGSAPPDGEGDGGDDHICLGQARAQDKT